MLENGNKKSLIPGVQFNAKKKRYEIIENGILYSITSALLESFEKYYGHRPSAEEWFAALNPHEKKEVIRLGLPENIQDYNDANLLNE
jgi:hypothetical protein